MCRVHVSYSIVPSLSLLVVYHVTKTLTGTCLASSPGPPPPLSPKAWYSLFVRTENIPLYFLLHTLGYSGKLSREKTLRIGEKYDFRMSIAPKDAMSQILRRKLSCIATKPLNSQKFFPSKVFRYTVLDTKT